MALAGAEAGFENYFLAPEAAGEALLCRGIRVYAPKTLAELAEHLLGRQPLAPAEKEEHPFQPENSADFSEVQGQVVAKRAMEIAAAGAHNLLMTGRPDRERRCSPGASPPFFRPCPMKKRWK